MNTTWPKSPWFFVLVFRSAAAKALCNCKLKEAWIVDKKLNFLFAFLVVESNQNIRDDFEDGPLPRKYLWGP